MRELITRFLVAIGLGVLVFLPGPETKPFSKDSYYEGRQGEAVYTQAVQFDNPRSYGSIIDGTDIPCNDNPMGSSTPGRSRWVVAGSLRTDSAVFRVGDERFEYTRVREDQFEGDPDTPGEYTVTLPKTEVYIPYGICEVDRITDRWNGGTVPRTAAEAYSQNNFYSVIITSRPRTIDVIRYDGGGNVTREQSQITFELEYRHIGWLYCSNDSRPADVETNPLGQSTYTGRQLKLRSSSCTYLADLVRLHNNDTSKSVPVAVTGTTGISDAEYGETRLTFCIRYSIDGGVQQLMSLSAFYTALNNNRILLKTN
jgi:hypothetical protein